MPFRIRLFRRSNRESEGLFEALRYMRGKGVHCMPVVDSLGWLEFLPCGNGLGISPVSRAQQNQHTSGCVDQT